MRWAFPFIVFVKISFLIWFSFSNHNGKIASHLIYTNQASKAQENSSNASDLHKQSKSAVDSEFVSDAFQTTDKDLDEVKAGMKLLGIDSLAKQSKKDDGKIPR